MQEPYPAALLPARERRCSAPAWRQLHAPVVAWVNRLCRQRSVQLDWFGVPAQVRVAGVRWLGGTESPWRHDLIVRVHWRGIDGYLGLNQIAAEAAMARHLGAVLWDELPPPVALALLQDGADRLSAAPSNTALGSFRFKAVVDAAEVAHNLCAVQLRITPQDSRELIALDWLVDLTAIESDNFPFWHGGSGRQATQADLLSDWGGLPVKVAFELGWVNLPLTELQGLQCHDVLLPDRWWAVKGSGRIGLRVGANTGWATGYTGVLDEDRRQIKVTGLQKMERDLPEEMLSAFKLSADPSDVDTPGGADLKHTPLNTSAAALGTLAPGALGDIPVRLTFDLGESSLTLHELAAIGVGHVFDLGLSLRGGVNLRVNGLRVGEGEIVEIDGRLGVAVTHVLPPRV